MENLLKELSKEFGVVWTEFNKRDQIIAKKKVFKTERALYSFVDKLEMKDNFNKTEAWLK